MNINDMMVFAEVVEKGGFTAAGDSLGRPKSNISRSVTRLEAAIGVTLLQRSTRHHTLTEAGRIYYQHSLRIKEELNCANLSIENLNDVPRGSLRVSTSVAAGQILIGPKLAGFIKAYPEVSLDLRLMNRRINLIEENFDVLIRVGSLNDSNLIARHLCTRTLHWYASPEYVKQHGPSIDPLTDLEQHKCIYMNATSESPQWTFHNEQGSHKVAFKPSFMCDDFFLARQMVLDGCGISKFPDYMCEAFVASGQLVKVFNTWHGPSVDFHAIVASRQSMTPKIKAFVEYLKTAFSDT